MRKIAHEMFGRLLKGGALGALLVACGVRGDEPVKAAAESTAKVETADDPYLWLENVTGEKALTWVRQQNAISTNELESMPGFEPLRKRLLSILDSKEKIPYVAKHGKYYYNFWRDQKNIRGLWRRTTLEEYKKAEPKWETVIDVDELSTAEKENWVWKGYTVLQPSYDRCLVQLSRGGADASVIREFDLKTKKFITEGFYLPEAKSDVAWRNHDVIYVGTDFGPGSLTDSGYPREVKEWKRGTKLSDAKLVFEGKTSDVSAGVAVVHDHGRIYEFVSRAPTFFTSEDHVRQGDKWLKIEKPEDAIVQTFKDQILLRLRSDWKVNDKTYPAGALLATGFDDYLKGKRNFEVLFTPTERKSLSATSATKNFLIVNELDNVRNRLFMLKLEKGSWTRKPIEAPELGSIGINGIDADESDEYFMTLKGFLTPLALHYGYGGVEMPVLPGYSAGVGSAWLERGGVYVLANIRGGGEFGPKWHEAARKQNRQRAYDDFISVAEDLIARKVTSPKHLGIQGGSNGGLLMGVMLTQRPDLFKAVVCQVPLLDMRRFNKLLAGASWMDEYGNPDKPEDWTYISKYSPYQNVSKDKKYSRVLFTTSTRDDRVHPGHARKMVAKMKDQ